ncbi:toxin-antitoxin system TumE family protein [Sulfobacillus thermosulfidooxidans]|uniref:toxin-antitoxin system TumE family protein n=1 Tax=Sulfobacillus thermosulfidooxidans TaxID=28034 RepID=UPI000314A20E|nr:DUF6516 family protein [Sulfobacillus thermosulfidooxidans]
MTTRELGDLLLQQFSDIVISVQINTGRVRAILRDESFIDIWFNDRGKYSYHWQEGRGAIYRFNNAPHHPEILTHPHHFHDGSQENIRESSVSGVTPQDVEIIMNFIRHHVNSRGL